MYLCDYIPVLLVETQRRACKIWLEGGEANTDPDIAAVSSPEPTKPIIPQERRFSNRQESMEFNNNGIN